MLPEFRRGLEAIVGEGFDFGSALSTLDDSDRYWLQLKSSLAHARENQCLTISVTKDPREFLRESRLYLENLGRAHVYIYFSNMISLGGLLFEATVLSEHLLDLLFWDGDTLLGGTKGEEFFMFDVTENSSDRLYEFSRWGGTPQSFSEEISGERA
jgi:hypothetical protein